MPAALTHTYLAHSVIKRLSTSTNDTIFLESFDGSGAKRTIQINQRLAQILRNNVAYFRAGMMAPDFYPDVFWGITISHQVNKKGATLANYLDTFAKSVDFTDEKEVAFVFGWFAHLCADVFGHHLMTNMANDPFLTWFDLTPQNKEVIRKHLGIEHFWDKQLTLPPEFSTTFFVPLLLLHRAMLTDTAPLCQRFYNDPTYPGIYGLIRLVRLEGWHRAQAEAVARYKQEGLRSRCLMCHAAGQIAQTIQETCPHCQGIGFLTRLHCPLCEDKGIINCPHCEGTGKISITAFGITKKVTCPICFGGCHQTCPCKLGQSVLETIQDLCPVCNGAKFIPKTIPVLCPICSNPLHILAFQKACDRIEEYHRRREAHIHATVDAYLQAHVCVNGHLLASEVDVGEVKECYREFFDQLPACLSREGTFVDLVAPELVDLAIEVKAEIQKVLAAFEALIPSWIIEIKEDITSWALDQLVEVLQLKLTDQEEQACKDFWSAQARPTINDFWPMYNGITLFLLGIDGCTPDRDGLKKAALILGQANNIDGGDQPYLTAPWTFNPADQRYFRPIVLPGQLPRPLLTSPVLVSPVEGEHFSNYPRTMMLIWLPVTGATGYKVEVEYAYREPTGALVWGSAYSSEVADTSVTFEFVGSQPGRWRVTAYDQDGVYQPSQPSAWRNFDYTYIPPRPLAAPVLVSPAEGQRFSNYPRLTTLTWQPVTGASGYKVEVEYASRSTAGNVVWSSAYSSEIADTSLTFEFVGAQPGRWRISACDHGAYQPSQPSAWRSFIYTT